MKFVKMPWAELALKKGEKTLRAWSAGWASGEEPYSVSLLWSFDLRTDGQRWISPFWPPTLMRTCWAREEGGGCQEKHTRTPLIHAYVPRQSIGKANAVT